MQPPEHELVTIAGDVRVAVPPSIELITTYVLKEQRDWFEDEMSFVRKLARPGMNVVDVGANYGVYALTIGKRIAPTGRLWAFEPGARTAAFLRVSVAANGLDCVTVIEAGLSDHAGSATLFTQENAELSTLNPEPGAGGKPETIALQTLDGAAEEHGFRDVAFMKLDAEGEELRILAGGRSFLATNDPLVMFELKHGSSVNTALVDWFEGAGFGIYRVLPGIDVLVPFDREGPIDPFQLNLFACTPARAATLEAAGHLAQALPPATMPRDADAFAMLAETRGYARGLGPRWNASAHPGRERVDAALSRYAVAHGDGSAAVRAAALQAALTEISAAIPGSDQVTRLLTVARIARELGDRRTALRALDACLRAFQSGAVTRCDEPFLPPCASYDESLPGSDEAEWAAAAVLEGIERLSHYSSYYSGPASLPRLRKLAELGRASPEMARRLKMVEARLPR